MPTTQSLLDRWGQWWGGLRLWRVLRGAGIVSEAFEEPMIGVLVTAGLLLQMGRGSTVDSPVGWYPSPRLTQTAADLRRRHFALKSAHGDGGISSQPTEVLDARTAGPAS